MATAFFALMALATLHFIVQGILRPPADHGDLLSKGDPNSPGG